MIERIHTCAAFTIQNPRQMQCIHGISSQFFGQAPDLGRNCGLHFLVICKIETVHILDTSESSCVLAYNYAKYMCIHTSTVVIAFALFACTLLCSCYCGLPQTVHHWPILQPLLALSNTFLLSAWLEVSFLLPCQDKSCSRLHGSLVSR